MLLQLLAWQEVPVGDRKNVRFELKIQQNGDKSTQNNRVTKKKTETRRQKQIKNESANTVPAHTDFYRESYISRRGKEEIWTRYQKEKGYHHYDKHAVIAE